MKPKKTILLIEDNEGDAELIVEALESNPTKSDIIVIDNGEDALEYLMSKNGNHNQIPDLILLDLNLPKIDGKEVLQYLKTDAATKRIPIVILTTSSLQMDITDSMNGHANAYIIKSGNIDELTHIMKCVVNFWIDCAISPFKN